MEEERRGEEYQWRRNRRGKLGRDEEEGKPKKKPLMEEEEEQWKKRGREGYRPFGRTVHPLYRFLKQLVINN